MPETGQPIAHYRIVAKIERGGTGEVYQAVSAGEINLNDIGGMLCHRNSISN